VRPAPEPPPPKPTFWGWLRSLVSPSREPTREQTLGAQEQRVLGEFCRQYGIPFRDLTLLKLALTHRSYLSVTGQGPRESNERLEFLGDSVLGLVTSEYLYRRHPDEHEGQLTKTKSLLVSKAILSRRALRMGLGRFVLMSHSEVESGGRQRLSILADAFESVIGAIYLDQGFEASRTFITQHLLAESDAITSDKRHTNYKSHLQEYVQNAFRTHPVYRIRSEFGPDHSKHFMVEVMVGKRTLGEGRGHNKKEAEQAAARDALEKVEKLRRADREEEARAERLPRSERARPERRPPPEPRGREERSSEARERSSEPRERFNEPRERFNEPRERFNESRGPGRPPARVPEPEFEPEVIEPASAADAELDEEAPSPRRRRRRGGRGRHAGSRSPEAPAAAADAGEDDFTRAVRAEAREIAGDFEDDDVDAAPEPLRAPDPEAVPFARAPSPEATDSSFGRAPAAAAEPARPDSAESRRVDPFASDEPATREAPVVDVAHAEPEAETETGAEREARIEEMERALDNFGRRRSLDYGRRGRRR